MKIRRYKHYKNSVLFLGSDYLLLPSTIRLCKLALGPQQHRQTYRNSY